MEDEHAARRDRTVGQLPRNPRRHLFSTGAATNSEATVPIMIATRQPRPTVIRPALIHLLPEALGQAPTAATVQPWSPRFGSVISGISRY